MGDEKAEKKESSAVKENIENNGEKTKEEKKTKKKGFISRIWNAIFRSNNDDFEKRLQYITKEENAVVVRMSNRSRSWRRTSRQLILFSVLFESLMMTLTWFELFLRCAFGGFGHFLCCGDFLMLLEIALGMWRFQNLDVVEGPKTLTLREFVAAIVVAIAVVIWFWRLPRFDVVETSKTSTLLKRVAAISRYLGIMRCLSSTFSKMRFSVWYLSSPLIANFSNVYQLVFELLVSGKGILADRIHLAVESGFSKFWGAYHVIAVGYAIMTTRSMDMNWKMRAIRVLPMFLLPALSTATYSTFKILERLRAERKAKIDELKEKTNYYITQQLIQRYDTDPAAKAAAATVLASKLGSDSGLNVYVEDDSSAAPTGKTKDVELVQSSGLRNRKQVNSRSTSPGTKTTNYSDEQLVGSGKINQTQTPEHNELVVVEHHPQSSAMNDGGWIARIAALLVGEDPTQSYALICGNCHMHNGLSRKEDFPFITYYCPHCHALNKPKHSDEHISLPNTDSPKADDGKEVQKAGASDSLIASDNPVKATPEIEEVADRAISGDES
ncbi:hypothetical protein V8G54_035679 [Vigna mungo]|uniref:Lunapark zinc ribbon domain-containing protein n=1 Tax=Vigna mungo TaxID=3915 RepID=A0AAQ3MFI7_VIGMU